MGNHTVIGTNLSGAGLDELYLVNDTERGDLFIDGNGEVVFRDSTSRYDSVTSALPRWIFGDGGGAELPYDAAPFDIDDAELVNYASITRSGGSTAQVAQDAASLTDNLISALSRTDLLMQTDAAAKDWAGEVVGLLSQLEQRFLSVTFSPPNDPRLWGPALRAELGDRITMRRRPIGGGTMIERDCFIESITHPLDPDVGTWVVAFELSDAEKWLGLVLDDPVRGVLDSRQLVY